jgi:L-ascorbate metabolism protein UlaG (beta-lactamase superfamily)
MAAAISSLGQLASAAVKPASAPNTTITWYGQSFFVVTPQKGGKIAFDPYHAQKGLRYTMPKLRADAIFVSHNHFDHNNVEAIAGDSTTAVLPLPQDTRKGVVPIGKASYPFHSVFSYHDADRGKERGGNTINILTVDGVRIAHLGDIGAPLTPEQVKQIGPVDILLVPVGGTYTVDAAGATKIVDQIKPRVVIPMHYKTPAADLPLTGVEPFLKGKTNVVRGGHSYQFTAKTLPAKTTIMVLQYK